MRQVQSTDKDGKYVFQKFSDFFDSQKVIDDIEKGEDNKESRLLEIARRNQEFLKNSGRS